MEQNQQQGQRLTFQQKMQLTQWLMRFPALTVMVFMRRDVGYRLLNPLHLLAVGVFMFFVSGILNPDRSPGDLLLFALLVLIAGAWQRAARWRELRRGERLHTFYLGTSRLPLPRFCRNNRRAERLLDPFFCVFGGLVLIGLSPVLGVWIVFSGFCLRGIEDAVYRQEIAQQLDMMDGLIVSEYQGEAVEHFSQGVEASLHHGETQGIPTGIAPDIQRHIQRRKTSANSENVGN